MKLIKTIIESIKNYFNDLHVIYQMSKEENLDGSWDNYWKRKNKKSN